MNIVFFSTFILFTIEALFHFNIGKNGLISLNCPSFVDCLKMVGVVAFFSAINSFIISKLEAKDKSKR
jgi:hypothetical protein